MSFSFMPRHIQTKTKQTMLQMRLYAVANNMCL